MNVVSLIISYQPYKWVLSCNSYGNWPISTCMSSWLSSWTEVCADVTVAVFVDIWAAGMAGTVSPVLFFGGTLKQMRDHNGCWVTRDNVYFDNGIQGKSAGFEISSFEGVVEQINPLVRKTLSLTSKIVWHIWGALHAGWWLKQCENNTPFGKIRSLIAFGIVSVLKNDWLPQQ